MGYWKFAAIALFAAPAPAFADDWAREVGGWDVGRAGDACVMTMEYEGEGATVVTLLIQEDATQTFLSVTNYGWSAKSDERYDLKYHLGEWVYTLPSVGIENSIIRKGFLAIANKEFLADFAKSDDLEITRDGLLVDDLSLDGSAAALVVLERCRSQLARDLDQQRRDREKLAHIPVDPFAPTPPTGPRDPTPTGTWGGVIATSYPSRARLAGLSGRVEMSLAVSAEGRVVACSIESSSGHAILDEAACQGAQRLGRFTPALDSEGRPTVGVYALAITYALD